MVSSNEQKRSSKQEDEYFYRRRPLADVLKEDAVNAAYFFAPLVAVHAVAIFLRPYILDPLDPRGPWEYLWHQIVKTTGGDRKWLFIWGNNILTFIMFWSVSLLFILLDLAQWPHFLYKYKIQTGKNTFQNLPEKRKLARLFGLVNFNFLLTLPVSYIGWFNYDKYTTARDVWAVPSVYETFFQMILAMIGHDAFFYHAHRIFHHKYLYKHIHKLHHEWTAPIAATSMYTHPLEHIVVGITSTNIAMTLTCAPIPLWWIWVNWMNFHALNDHSGFHFPWVHSPEFHDFHHLRFHTSFGWFSFWDWFYGTDAEFEKSKIHRARHIRLKTLASARELVPDEIKEE